MSARALVFHGPAAGLLLAVLAAGGCGGSDTVPPAAVIAGDTIPCEEMALMLERVRGDSALVLDVVDNLIDSRLVVADARARGLDATPQMQRFRYEREREQLQNAWLAWYLENRVTVDPDTVRAYYDQLGTQVVYTVLNVRDSTLCDSLRRLVLGGSDLRPLVAQFSTIPWDVQTQGVVGPVDLMRTSDADRSLLLGLEPGEVSPMGLYPSGWRFLTLDSTYQAAVGPFEDLQTYITDYIRAHEMEIRKRFMEDSLREANHLRVGEGIPELVVLHALDPAGNYEPYTPAEEAMPAYTFDGGSRSVISLVENIRSLPPALPRNPTDIDWVEGYCSILGLYDIMAMEARELGMDTLPDVVSFVDRACTSRLLDDYYTLVIAPRLTPAAGELRELYEANEGMFLIPESRTFETLSAVGAGQMELLAGLLDSGTDPFLRLDDLSMSEGLTAPGDSTRTAPLTLEEIPPPWDSILFAAQPGEAVLCTLSADRVILFRIAGISPGRTATFEEAEDELTELVRAEKEEETVLLLVDSLRSVYHYEVDFDFVRRFFEGSDPEGDAGGPDPVPADSQTSG